jgi:uncharacterized membrane protein
LPFWELPIPPLTDREAPPRSDSGDIKTQRSAGCNPKPPGGINNAGQIVGISGDAATGIINSFVYSGGVYAPFSVPGHSGGTEAMGINDAGQIVGGIINSPIGSYPSGFLYSSDGIYTLLNVPGANYGTFANGINNRGQVVGEFSRTSTGSLGSVKESGFLYDAGVSRIVTRGTHPPPLPQQAKHLLRQHHIAIQRAA